MNNPWDILDLWRLTMIRNGHIPEPFRSIANSATPHVGESHPQEGQTMEQKHLDQGSQYPSLGPHYFAAREVTEKFMAQFAADQFEPLMKKAADEFYEALHTRLQDFLLLDVENNIHGAMWRQIDESVRALLSGERWALERYTLQGKYDCEKIREAVAKHIPTELQDKRVTDLEQEVARLRESLAFHQRR